MHDGRVKVFVALGRQFPSAHARHAVHGRSHRALPPDRADLDQAQPRPPDHGRAGADPPVPGPHRTATCRSRASSSSPWKTRRASSTCRAACCRRRRNTLRSEPAIVAGIARATLQNKTTVDWEGLIDNYDRIREHIEHVIPGFEQYNVRVRQPGGFYLPNPPHEGQFQHAVETGPLHRPPDSRTLRARGAAAVDDDPQPRPVQHHHLQRERPLSRHLRRPAGRFFSTPTTSPAWVCEKINGSTSSATLVQRRGGRNGSRSSPTKSPSAVRRPIIPRRTCWSRFSTRPSGSNQPVSKSLIISLEPAGATIPSTAAEPSLTHA